MNCEILVRVYENGKNVEKQTRLQTPDSKLQTQVLYLLSFVLSLVSFGLVCCAEQLCSPRRLAMACFTEAARTRQVGNIVGKTPAD